MLLVVAIGGSGCEPGRGEVRQWQPNDHDRADQPAQQAQPNQAAPQPKRPPNRAETVWRTACANCHGPQGRGDGPNGPSTGAPDLTRDDWLSTVTDEQIFDTIKRGKGEKMPPNPNLPDSAIQLLIQRIRNKGR
ncbi:MAG: cytochrome c [Polyangiaceae bacterium]|nr:cytochrome c [Polyangiaceae bacterium]